jgi:hypothetical protein
LAAAHNTVKSTSLKPSPLCETSLVTATNGSIATAGKGGNET